MQCDLKSLIPTLLRFYDPAGPERVGFILPDNIVVEVKNIHPKPEEGFDIGPDDLVRYCEEAIGTWHTHPGATSNPSMEDFNSFKLWKKQFHLIVGSDGLRRCWHDADKSAIMTEEVS